MMEPKHEINEGKISEEKGQHGGLGKGRGWNQRMQLMEGKGWRRKGTLRLGLKCSKGWEHGQGEKKEKEKQATGLPSILDKIGTYGNANL